jgi:predicted ABC-type ATPase
LNPPKFTLIAGTNGAGKTTVTSTRVDTFAGTPILDPDAIEKSIQSHLGESSSMAAGRIALKQAEEYLRDGTSFSIETTLSGKSYLNMMRRAKALGFEIELFYIGTGSVEINLERIAKRVAGGGHDIPEETVRRRYERSLENLLPAIHLADRTILYDNSIRFRFVGIVEGLESAWKPPVPKWTAALIKQLPLKRPLITL